MKALKKIIIILVILAVVLVGGIYIAASFIDKGFVEEQVSKAIGRELKINGDITPQLSLNPTVKITDATLANAEWGSKAPLAKVGEVEVTLQLVPLLSKDIQIDSVTLKNSQISLEKNKGEWNFDFDTDEETAAKAAAEKEASAKKAADKKAGIETVEEPKTAAKLSIGDINVENVKISVKDGKTSNYTISNFSIGNGNETSDINLGMVLDGEKVNLSGRINPLTKIANDNEVSIQNMDLTYGKYKVKANVEGNTETMKFKVSNLRTNLEGNAITGNLSANLSKKVPYISGSINLANLDFSSAPAKDSAAVAESTEKSTELYSKTALPLDSLKLLNADLNVKVKSLKLNDQLTFTDITIPAKISNNTLSAKNIVLKNGGGTINASFSVNKSNSSLVADIKSFEAGKLFLGNDFTGGSTDANFNFTSSGNSIHSLVNNLSGTSKIHLSDAKYSGVVKDGLLKKLVKLLAGGTAATGTEIECAIVNADWSNGIGTIKDLGVVSDSAIVAGSGKVKLPTQKLKIVLKPEAKSIGLTDLIVPPIAISGTFSNISVYPEAKGTAVEAVKVAAGIATGVGIFAKLGEVIADKTGVSESMGLKSKNICDVK